MDRMRTYCLNIEMVTTNGLWTNDKPIFHYAFPSLICEIILTLLVSRLLAFLLKPLRQPRVISEIITGVLLGPSLLARRSVLNGAGENLFHPRWAMTMETGAHLGVIYFLFLVGVGMDVGTLKRNLKKGASIAAVSVVVPFILTFLVSSSVVKNLFPNQQQSPPSMPAMAPLQEHLSRSMLGMTNDNDPATDLGSASGPNGLIVMNKINDGFHFLISLLLATTSVPVLARIVTETRLLNTELGRLAVCSAVLNEMITWILIAAATAAVAVNGMDMRAVWVGFSCAAFILFCFYIVRPGLEWMVRHTPEGEQISPSNKGLILVGVIGAAAVSELIGIHAVFGAFVFGLVVPAGPLSLQLPEMIGDSVISLLMPLYFVAAGLKTNLYTVNDHNVAASLVVVFIVSSVTKLGSTLVVAQFFDIPFREALCLGFLMSSNGLILLAGANRMSLDTPTYTVVVLASLVATMVVAPAIAAWYRPTKPPMGMYRRRNVQLVKPGSELQLVAPVHTGKNVPSLLALLEAANPTKSSPVFVFTLHLIELVGRATSMLIVHPSNSRNTGNGREQRISSAGGGAESEHIISALEAYEQRAGGVSVQAITAITPFATMHEEVLAVAEENRAALIILPFQKQPIVDVSGTGQPVPTNDAIRELNRSILSAAPCSVAILVDKGLGVRIGRQKSTSSIALIFFGGPDDREALSFASRMAERPGTNLMVVRFVPGEKAIEEAAEQDDDNTPTASREMMPAAALFDVDAERVWDSKALADFKSNFTGYEQVAFVERVVNNCEETVSAIRALGGHYDLYLVGRKPVTGSAVAMLTAGLEEWIEYQELGPIGDLVAARDFASMSSVLVFQQYVVDAGDGYVGPQSPAQTPTRNQRGPSSNFIVGP